MEITPHFFYIYFSIPQFNKMSIISNVNYLQFKNMNKIE